MQQAKPCTVEVAGGIMYHHGQNLSKLSDTLTLEDNIVFLLHGREADLTPAPPRQMRDLWAKWSDDATISAKSANYLWGDGAAARWDIYRREQTKRQRDFQRGDFFRMLPRLLIDRLGIRPLLYRLGVVKSPHRRT